MPPVTTDGFFENKSIEQNSSLLYLKKGITQLRVLPAYGEHGKWFREIKEISLRVNGRYSPQVSPATDGKPCPFMMEGQRYYNMGGEENIEIAKKFRPRSSFLFNVVVHSNPEGIVNVNNSVKVLKCGVKVFRQILDLDQDVAGGWGDITNLTEGFDLRISRTGNGRFDTEYTVKAIPNKTSLLDYLESNGFDQKLSPHNLDEMFASKSFEDLTEMLNDFKAELDTPEDVETGKSTVSEQLAEARPEAPVQGGIEAPALPQ